MATRRQLGIFEKKPLPSADVDWVFKLSPGNRKRGKEANLVSQPEERM